MTLTLILTRFITLAYPYPYPFSTPEPDHNLKSYSNPIS